MKKDLYEILGIGKDATDKDIKSAYRKLALSWHPDKHKGDKDAETKFKEINVAYEILSDKQKRQQYDAFGSTGGPGGYSGGQGFNGGFDFSGFNDMGGFADIFESFFGGSGGGKSKSRGKRSTAIRGNDIEATIKIAFEEAVFGTEKELEITKAEVCKHCNGNGVEPGSRIVTCKTCSGAGEIRAVRNTILGQMATYTTCEECYGEGKVPEKKCTACHGATRVRGKERVKVKIPAGVDNGSSVRVTGKGEAGIKSGGAGDLYIVLMVESSKKFVRHGIDIHSILEIHVLQAILGAEVNVETLYGKEKIKISPGTYDGKVFELADKGVQKLNTNLRGKHLIKVKVSIPEKLSKKEKEMYADLAKEANVEVKEPGLFW